jgi:predicted Zn-dependent protease
MMARVLLAVVAVLALAWLGVQRFHTDALREASYQRFVERNVPQGEFDRVQDRLRRARRLTPDAEADLERAGLHLERGNLVEAARIAAAVTREEPENLSAWGVVLRAARAQGDGPGVARARAEIRRLGGG